MQNSSEIFILKQLLFMLTAKGMNVFADRNFAEHRSLPKISSVGLANLS